MHNWQIPKTVINMQNNHNNLMDTHRQSRLTIVGMVLVIFALILPSCTGTRLDTRASVDRLESELPHTWTTMPDTTAPLSARFLDLINEDRLRDLVHEAMVANPDLRAAARRVEASHRLLIETRAVRWPFVEVGHTTVRSNQAFDDLGKRIVETEHRASLNISWEVDVWKRLADLHDEHTRLTAAQAADFAAARDALGARVIQAWITTASLRQALALETERIQVLVQLQETIQRRYRRGIGTLDDLAAARTSTALARATVVALREDHDQTVRALELLLGRPPKADLLTTDILPTIQLVSPGYPARAIAQRHDIAAALWRLEAADAAAAAAAKAMLPSLRLTTDIAKNKSALAGLLNAPSIWSIGGALSQPLFQRGRLRARSDARRLELEASWEEYHAAVLQAVGEIEDGLGRERALIEQRDHLVNALGSSTRNTQIQEERYRRGLASITELLLARNQEMNIRRQVIAFESDILNNRITIALAVGAGFEEQPL